MNWICWQDCKQVSTNIEGYFHFLKGKQADRAGYAKVIHHHFEKLRIENLLTLSADFNNSWWVDRNRIEAIFSNAFSGIEQGDEKFALLALGTFHANGYFREKCMPALKPYGARALPFLMR